MDEQLTEAQQKAIEDDMERRMGWTQCTLNTRGFRELIQEMQEGKLTEARVEELQKIMALPR